MADSRTRELQQGVSNVILKSYIDPREDLKAERRKATFNPDDLTLFLYGKTNMEKRRRCAQLVTAVPELSREDTCFLSGVELYKYSFQQFNALTKVATENGLTSIADTYMLKEQFGHSPFPTELHFSMFLNAVENQADDQQREEWLPKIYGGSILGTYAQTELGHGTFLRGLETTATFDKERDEFVLHSPTDTATKWWPGGLGRTSTHCLLYARLFLDGKDYGPHAFLVQLRSMEDHKPLPGITLGDIGPKLGWSTIDNGFLRLDHVRIPRNQMLMRFAKVSRDGVYDKPPHAKFNYTTMVFVRTGMVEGSFQTLGKAITIAIRYSCARRQGGAQPDSPEKQVLDYPTQQHALFTQLANAYAILFTARALRAFFTNFANRKDDQDFSILPELHATSAGLKALTTETAAEGTDACRRYCGGHGYHRFSALPDLLNDHHPLVTGEGVNPVLYLQTARYLVRQAENLKNGTKVPPTLDYLARFLSEKRAPQCSAKSPDDLLNPDVLQECFWWRAARLIFEAFELVSDFEKKGGSFEGAIEHASIDLIRVARAHCYCFLLNNFVDAVKSVKEQSYKAPLQQLLSLFALGTIERELGEFSSDGFLSPQQCRWVQGHTRTLLPLIRPNAVTLVDAFDFSDFSLNSSLGRYDGDVYRDMYRRAQKEPRNQTPQGPAYDEIKAFLTKSFL